MYLRLLKQQYLISKLAEIFKEIKKSYQLPDGDFPNVDEYRAHLQLLDFTTFPKIDRKVLNSLQSMLLEDIPKIAGLVAGVSNSRSVKDSDDADTVNANAKQVQMFTLTENGKEGQGNMIAVLSVVILILAVVIASFVDNHATLNLIMQKVSEMTRQK